MRLDQGDPYVNLCRVVRYLNNRDSARQQERIEREIARWEALRSHATPPMR